MYVCIERERELILLADGVYIYDIYIYIYMITIDYYGNKWTFLTDYGFTNHW